MDEFTSALVHLTMPAALFSDLASAYRFLARVFSFTEPTNTMPFTFLRQKEKLRRCPLRVTESCRKLGSHGEVGDERSFGDLHVEGDALSFGARVDHRAPDGDVSKARRDAALHLVAPDRDVLATHGLDRQQTCERSKDRVGCCSDLFCCSVVGFL